MVTFHWKIKFKQYHHFTLFLEIIMIIGNQDSITLLRKYIDIFLSGKPDAPHFLILTWPANIGKSIIVQEIAKEILGQYFLNNFLHIRDLDDRQEKDLTDSIWKKHILKVKTPDKPEKRFVKLSKTEIYEDLWIREINLRLQQSSMGKLKIVLLENIERMNDASANAFLKTCEEPMPGKLIIATTSHQSQILDTIISRAVLIKFHPLSHQDLLKFADENDLFTDNAELKEFACNMAMWRPWALVRLDKTLSQDDELRDDFIKLMKLLPSWKNFHQSHSILTDLHNNWSFISFLDWRISYCTQHWLTSQWARRLQVKKMMRTNASVENLILYWLLNN